MVLVCYPLVIWIANKLVPKIRNLAKTYRAMSDTITEIAQDVLSGIMVVRSFSLEPYFQDSYPLADLLDGNTLHYKLFPSDKF